MAFCWPVRVYIEDTDFGGVVYYVNYLKFMERARTELLRASGWSQESLRESGYLFLVGQVSAKYRAPARLDDLIEIRTSLSLPRGARVQFTQTAVRCSDARVLCEAQVEVICVTAESLKPTRWPARISESIVKHLPHAIATQE